MKIISNFKDYYDGVSQSIGIDEHIIYIRDNKEIESVLNFYIPINEDIKYLKFNSRVYTTYKFTILGVAGKLYPLLIIYPGLNNKEEIRYIYDIEIIQKIHNNIWNQKNKWRLNYNNWFNYINLLNNKLILNYFHEYKVGSFILSMKKNNSKYILELEPILNKLEFYKCVDAFTLFNEMSIFIGQQLNTEIDSYPMTDIQKVKSKGFDDKYGFRTRPKK